MARQSKTQAELAEALGMPKQVISLRMLGRRAFRAEELAAIANWLGVPIGVFVPPAENRTEVGAA